MPYCMVYESLQGFEPSIMLYHMSYYAWMYFEHSPVPRENCNGLYEDSTTTKKYEGDFISHHMSQLEQLQIESPCTAHYVEYLYHWWIDDVCAADSCECL